MVKLTLSHTNIATINRYIHRLNYKLLSRTDGLLAGASLLKRQGKVVAIGSFKP